MAQSLWNYHKLSYLENKHPFTGYLDEYHLGFPIAAGGGVVASQRPATTAQRAGHLRGAINTWRWLDGHLGVLLKHDVEKPPMLSRYNVLFWKGWTPKPSNLGGSIFFKQTLLNKTFLGKVIEGSHLCPRVSHKPARTRCLVGILWRS